MILMLAPFPHGGLYNLKMAVPVILPKAGNWLWLTLERDWLLTLDRLVLLLRWSPELPLDELPSEVCR